MVAKNSHMDRPAPQTELKHPPEWSADLNPDFMKGQNVGTLAEETEPVRYASELKELRQRWQGFDLSELREIPVLLQGARLKQGATYALIGNSDLHVLRAQGGAVVQEGYYAVPKAEVPYQFWNRLINAPVRERRQ